MSKRFLISANEIDFALYLAGVLDEVIRFLLSITIRRTYVYMYINSGGLIRLWLKGQYDTSLYGRFLEVWEAIADQNEDPVRQTVRLPLFNIVETLSWSTRAL